MAELDSQIGRLRHQLASLPEQQQIQALEKTRAEQTDRVRDARILVDDLTREQRKADADVEQVKARRERDRSRIDQGLVTNPKDLQRMNHELESLERRISDLEDVELDVMERLEAAQEELARGTRELEEAEQQIAELAESRDRKAGETGVELERVAGDRQTAVADLPEDLLGLYEKIRDKWGVGAAALRARQCGGCQLTLNAADLSVIAKAPVDEVVRCEECTRILVRTPESGL